MSLMKNPSPEDLTDASLKFKLFKTPPTSSAVGLPPEKDTSRSEPPVKSMLGFKPKNKIENIETANKTVDME